MKTDDRIEHPGSFEVRLRDGLERIAQADPISNPGLFDPDLMPIAFDRQAPRRGSTRLLVGAAAAVVATVGGLVAMSMRDTYPDMSVEPAQQPETESASETVLASEPRERSEPLPDGALILDQFPAALTDALGYTYVSGDPVVEPTLPANAWVQRWYTAATDQPELQPHLKLATTSTTQQYPPQIPPPGADADQKVVQGHTAWLYDDPVRSGRVAAFVDGETLFVLTGYQFSDDELLRVAENTRLADDGVGAVIDPGALPTGLAERAVGTADEGGFHPLETLEYAGASVRWYNTRADGGLPADDEPMLWLGWSREDPDLFPLNRLDYATVTDTTVHGAPAFVANNLGHLAIFWSENGYTYTLGGWGLDQDTVLTAANDMRPATAAEWNAFEIEPGSAAAPA